jgi:hypothetical protein
MTKSDAEAVWIGGKRLAPVEKEVAASCVTAVKF